MFNTKQIINLIVVLTTASLFFSCKEESKPNIKTNSSIPIIYENLLIQPQPYFSLVGSLEMNKKVLKSKKVKSYKTSFSLIDSTNKIYKSQFKNIQPKVNEIVFAELKIKGSKVDTISSKKITAISSTENKYFLKQVGAKGMTNYSLVEKLNAQQEITQVVRTNLSTKKTDKENIIYKEGLIVKKEYSNIGNEFFLYDNSKNPRSFIFINAKGDTNLAYKQLIKDKHILVTYYKGSREFFDYLYNNENDLVEIKWKENNKLKVHLTFSYNEKHLVKTRTIVSNLKAFPSCKIIYEYDYLN